MMSQEASSPENRVKVNIRYWDNGLPREQCDHNPPEEWGIATGDGWVYYIRTFDDTGDYDGDGCANGRELVTASGSERNGGRRDPDNEWDYYDVSVPKDGKVELFADVLGVISHFAPFGAPPYDATYDRGPSQGPNPWNMTAPDGKIELFVDILGVIGQFFHNCE